MIKRQEEDPDVKGYRVYTDDSAFLNERVYNSSKSVGSNTYPYVNGIVWESMINEGNTISIVSNRPGGVNINSIK